VKCPKCPGTLINDEKCKPFIHGSYNRYLHRCDQCGFVKRLGEDYINDKVRCDQST
jgi:RNase P subunit RPR2